MAGEGPGTFPPRSAPAPTRTASGGRRCVRVGPVGRIDQPGPSTMSITHPPDRPRSGDDSPLDPVAVLLWLGLVGALGAGLVLAGLSLHLAQQLTAVAFVLVAVGLTLRSATNGIVLLFLLPP